MRRLRSTVAVMCCVFFASHPSFYAAATLGVGLSVWQINYHSAVHARAPIRMAPRIAVRLRLRYAAGVMRVVVFVRFPRCQTAAVARSYESAHTAVQSAGLQIRFFSDRRPICLSGYVGCGDNGWLIRAL